MYARGNDPNGSHLPQSSQSDRGFRRSVVLALPYDYGGNGMTRENRLYLLSAVSLMFVLSIYKTTYQTKTKLKKFCDKFARCFFVL